ncbi:MAG: ubiquinol-cytochrome c reductase iron-sulfur subunit [Candidatus Rokubacteria bacterium]|nr:ubiquinol-cytochrome c reductase iron-sulfur subunit [Candidatus Rokubacteria bacterium]
MERKASGPLGESVSPPAVAPGRRRLLTVVLGGILTAIAGVVGAPLAAFFALPALRLSERRWLEVGRLAEFPEGEIKKVLARPLTAQAWPYETPRVTVYVLNRGAGKFTVFNIHCTHVGCPVRWNPQAGRFFSPCHGGVFDRDGRVLAGPPPRPLDRYEYKVEKGVLYAGRAYKVTERLEFREWHHA